MAQMYEAFEDGIRLEKITEDKVNQYSKYCDFIYYRSSVDPELLLAMRILKPEKPSYILAETHGWHQSVAKFENFTEPQSAYLKVMVDMRGRAFSDGKQDCNGLELIDVYDAIEYVKEHYSEYILDKEVVYFEAGSGGGGNAFAIAAKFPDYFAHVVSMSGMSDYALWYRNDKVGEFRDELDVWVGDIANGTAYAARSGLKLLENLNTPMAIMHGELDRRVPEEHSALYVKRAREIGKGKLVTYLNLRNIGGRVHYEFMDDNHLLTMETFFDSEREKYCEPTKLPRQGTLLIGGYLYTKHFRIMLDSMDKMAQVTYNLDTNEFKVSGVSEDEYTLTVL